MNGLRMVGLIIGLVALGVLGHWRGGFGALFLFYTFMFVTVILLILMFLQNQKIHLVRHCLRKYEVGDSIQVEVTVSVTGRLPVFWLGIQDEWHEQWLFLGFRRVLHYTYTIDGVGRGKVQRKLIELRREDPLGLFGITKKVEAPLRFIVLPKRLHWPVEPLLQRATVADDWHELRQYQEGDSLQRMHWKLSAKRQLWIVRERSSQSAASWMVFLDGTKASWNQADRSRSSDERPTIPAFERAVQFAAYFVRRVSSHVSCGILCMGNERVELPLRFAKHTEEVPHMLASVDPDGHRPFHEVLRQEGSRLPGETSVLCMTSTMTSSLARSLVQLSRSGRFVACVLCGDDRSVNFGDEQSLKLLRSSGCYVVTSHRFSHGGGELGA